MIFPMMGQKRPIMRWMVFRILMRNFLYICLKKLWRLPAMKRVRRVL